MQQTTCSRQHAADNRQYATWVSKHAIEHMQHGSGNVQRTPHSSAPLGRQSACLGSVGRSERLSEVYTKLHEIGADSAEARASAILSGLQVNAHIGAGTDWAHPCLHRRRDWAHPCPPLQQDLPRPARIGTGTARAPACRRSPLATRALHCVLSRVACVLSRVACVLSCVCTVVSLQFLEEQKTWPTRAFSGGWRMRISIAKVGTVVLVSTRAPPASTQAHPYVTIQEYPLCECSARCGLCCTSSEYSEYPCEHVSTATSNRRCSGDRGF